MRYANIRTQGHDRLAVATSNGLASLPSSVGGVRITGIEDLLALQNVHPDRFHDLLDEMLASAAPVSSNDVTFRSVVEHPSKILCIGLNYRRHAEETHSSIPICPVVFGVFNNVLAGHGDGVPIPKRSSQVDYEVELAVVVGKRCRNVSAEEALGCVFGYTVANDISARDLQNVTSQWLAGKSLDRFCPTGPFLATADEVGNPNALKIQLRLNGELRQNSNTSDMIFSCEQLLEYLSSLWTLEPGDIVLTGTPEGVILGRPEAERVWIQPGDYTDAFVEKIGTLTNSYLA